MNSEEWEQRVTALWADDTLDDQQRIDRMKILARNAPHPAIGAFELGGAFDSGGDEAEADVHYTAAAMAGLDTVDPDRAAQLVVQHASTLRNIGRINEAIAMLRDAPDHRCSAEGLPCTCPAQRRTPRRGASCRDRGRRAHTPPIQPFSQRLR